MLGAICGDILGSTVEFNEVKYSDISKIKLCLPTDDFTDDTALTLAVTDWLLNDIDNFSEHFAAQLKFVALEQCDLGDAIIDGDLFIKKINALKIIEGADVDCVYSFYEPCEYTLRGDMQDYYKQLITIMNKYEYKFPYHLPIYCFWPYSEFLPEHMS